MLRSSVKLSRESVVSPEEGRPRREVFAEKWCFKPGVKEWGGDGIPVIISINVSGINDQIWCAGMHSKWTENVNYGRFKTEAKWAVPRFHTSLGSRRSGWTKGIALRPVQMLTKCFAGTIHSQSVPRPVGFTRKSLHESGCPSPLKRCSVLFFSRPRSEGWPHHGRTFSIYLCPLSFWLTLPQTVLSTSWCCPSRPSVAFLACVHLALFLALFLSPGNSLVLSDHSMLASLLWRCPTVPSLLQLC